MLAMAMVRDCVTKALRPIVNVSNVCVAAAFFPLRVNAAILPLPRSRTACLAASIKERDER
jgi:hypothetical protein